MFISNALVTGLLPAFAVSASAMNLQRDQGGREIGLCHKACGQAIGLSHQTQDACSFTPFLTQYQACLDCAGSTGVNIWQQYMYKLSPVGEMCGLSTAPGEAAEAPSATTSANPASAPSSPADFEAPSETTSNKTDEASSLDKTSETDETSPATTTTSKDEDNAAASLGTTGALAAGLVTVLGAVTLLF